MGSSKEIVSGPLGFESSALTIIMIEKDEITFRKYWKVDPRTKVVKSKKDYNRAREKRKARKEWYEEAD